MICDKLIAESTISFTRGYNVEEYLLGQKYRFELDKRFDMEVMLPHGVVNDGFGEMVAPDDYHEDDDVEWGMYSPASKDSLPACHIESVYVRLWAVEGINLSAIRVGFDNPWHLIQKTLTKLLMNIRVINPKCVMRINGKQFDGGDIESMKFAQLSLTGIMEEWSVGNIKSNTFYDALSKRQLLVAFNNLHNEVSVPYSIYETARAFLDVMDSRNCILALATMVEVVYKQKMDEYFRRNNVPIELRQKILRKTYGLKKYEDFFKDNCIEFHDKDIEDKIMSIRHRVIHANKETKGKEALDAYAVGRNFLNEYHIPMFIK